MTPHISLNRIADHILELKMLDAASMKHMEDCVECRSDFQWLKVLRNLAVSPPSAKPKVDAA
jgi:hypothetical protein